MKKTKVLLITSVILLVIILIMVLREVGVIELYYYKSTQKFDQNSTQIKNGDTGKNYEITIILKDGEKVLNRFRQSQSHVIASNEENCLEGAKKSQNQKVNIEVEANIIKLNYTGNYYLPFYKKFRLEYICDLITVSENDFDMSGNIKGYADISVKGVCSTRRARGIAYDHAIEQINKYLFSHFTSNSLKTSQ